MESWTALEILEDNFNNFYSSNHLRYLNIYASKWVTAKIYTCKKEQCQYKFKIVEDNGKKPKQYYFMGRHNLLLEQKSFKEILLSRLDINTNKNLYTMSNKAIYNMLFSEDEKKGQ